MLSSGTKEKFLRPCHVWPKSGLSRRMVRPYVHGGRARLLPISEARQRTHAPFLFCSHLTTLSDGVMFHPMGTKPYKLTFGECFSDGSRQLWEGMAERGLTQPQVAVLLRIARSTINRWLYGERRPEWPLRFLIQSEFGIDPFAWDRPTSVSFAPPARTLRTGTDD